MLGPAPVVDFDGTVAHLGVDWNALRSRFGVRSIVDLWQQWPSAEWDAVREAEVTAAAIAVPIEPMHEALLATQCFAVLTNNSEDAIRVYLARFDPLAARTTVVVGRETLGGPKTDSARFEAGYAACRTATDDARGDLPVTYVGDQEYELDFARRLGARTLDIRSVVEGTPPG